jgi:hypothetical protein
MYEKLLEQDLRVLGPIHRETLGVARRLAEDNQAAGERQRAEGMLDGIQEAAQRAHGDGPDALRAALDRSPRSAGR